jgi:hypothetical protein
MSSKTTKNAVAFAAGTLGVVGAVVLTMASPSWAAPIASNAAAVRTAAPTQVTDIYYRRRGYYRRGYYGGRGYYRGGYGYYGGYAAPYGGYAYPYPYPYAYPYYAYPAPVPYAGFGFGF